MVEGRPHAASRGSPFVGVVEIVCGIMLMVGMLTRLAAIPLIIDMLVAIATTKVPRLRFGSSTSCRHGGTVQVPRRKARRHR
jgi:uncharacterized membrane protein YphA (DoxX/SURF4 family)